MSDFSTSNQSESIDTETGEIRYRKTLAKPVAAQRTSRGKIPSIHVENHITIFTKRGVLVGQKKNDRKAPLVAQQIIGHEKA